MKKIISIIFLALFVAAGSVAQNMVSISSGQGVPGDVVTVDVVLQNSDDVTAAEVVIPLVNKQLTYVDGSCVMDSERANGHSLSAAVVNGALKIYIYSISLAQLNDNDGKVASFALKLGNVPAEYPLQPQVLLSDAAGKALPVSVDNGAVTVLAPQIEVVTQSVDFGHVPIMSQYTKNFTLRNSGTLPLTVTDIESDDSDFSVAETAFTIPVGATKSVAVEYSPKKRGAVESAVTILSDATNGNASVKLIADPYSVNELHSNRVEGSLGEEVTVELRMNNMEPIVGVQTTFTLPAGIEYVDGSFASAERASSHTAMASVRDNKLTLILYSLNNTPVSGNDGVVATFRLKLDCNSGNYRFEPQNTVLSNAAVENMMSAVSGNYIVVKSPDLRGENALDFGKTPVTEVAKANYSVRNNGRATLVIS
ncbi:MAG: choice-of-anchor D domain-containing protein, partial [Bacteroidaceae bacterium]|nr:choice-of-anchor D domain-containing protein [Bacteroidaceae bacterium]